VEVKSMEVKKAQQQTPSVAEAKVSRRKGFDYIEEIKSEFNAINWTSREELKTYTQVTVGATFILGMLIYAVDLSIQLLLGMLTMIVQFIVG